MSFLSKVGGGLRALFRRQETDHELDEELSAYLEAAVEEKQRSGMSHGEALQAARAEMGSRTAIKDQVHGAGWESVVEDFGRDLRFGARMLRRSPSVTMIAVFTLALGIGMNAGIFTILNGAALRLLPVPHAQGLFMVSQDFSRSTGTFRRSVHNNASLFSYSEYQDYRDHNQVFTGTLAYVPFVKAALGGARPQSLLGTLVSCNYFRVLEVQPALGPGFSDSDCAADAAPVVVLSDKLWRANFGADPGIIGKNISLNRASFVVAGIAPAEFFGTEPVESQFWAPLTLQQTMVRDRDFLHDDHVSWLAMIGRIKPEVSPAQARADLAVIAARIDQLQKNRVTTIAVDNATLFSVPEERSLLLGAGAVVLAGVGLVLLVACANVANLLLARATTRRKEIAVKRALGASRGRLIRQLLTESLLLALLGSTVGTVVAVWLSAPLLKFLLSNLPQGTPPFAVNVSPDLHVLGFMLLLAFVTAIAFGLAPALDATRTELTLAMKDEGAENHAGPGRGGWMRTTLVGVQVAICTVLLLTAGLLLRGLESAGTIDPGFSMKNTALISFDLIGAGYDQQKAVEFQRRLMERLSAIPGVDTVAQAGVSPLSDDHVIDNFSVPGRKEEFDIEFTHVSPAYFPLLRLPIVRGRNFTEAENRAGSPVVILTESTARRLWPGEDPIGKSLRDGAGETARQMEVIGIAKDAQVADLGKIPKLFLFLPAGPKEQSRMLVMAHGGDSAGNLQEIRKAAQALDPELAIQVAKLEDNMEFWKSLARIPSVLSGALGGLALLLAAIGVYGMVSYAVSRRIREIGIRMALGADVGNITSLVVRQSVRPVIVGALIGIAACAAISRLMSNLLYGISPWDPLSFVLVPAFLFSVALLACWLPARRAARVNPVDSLRCG